MEEPQNNKCQSHQIFLKKIEDRGRNLLKELIDENFPNQKKNLDIQVNGVNIACHYFNPK